jgi:hypothetical protein
VGQASPQAAPATLQSVGASPVGVGRVSHLGRHISLLGPRGLQLGHGRQGTLQLLVQPLNLLSVLLGQESTVLTTRGRGGNAVVCLQAGNLRRAAWCSAGL